MRARLAVIALGAASLAACDQGGGAAPKQAEAPVATAPTAPSAPGETKAATAGSAPASSVSTASAPPAAEGAPPFAVLYPGAEIDAAPVTADGGSGGLVTFTTEASPDAVVAFYRDRAEAAGLASVMSLNQGDARAYGASAQSSGATLQVVANPVEDAGTTVQLTWTTGR